ncbi:MAG: malectin domain-containing carbohydrate-binding protein [Flavobacteriaceae bacterium]
MIRDSFLHFNKTIMKNNVLGLLRYRVLKMPLKSFLMAIGAIFLCSTTSFGQDQLIKRINCGGGQETGADGYVYEADVSNSDVSFSAGSGAYTNLQYVAPELQEPYLKFRYMNRNLGSEFSYTFHNLESGEYRVILHFAEPFHGVQNSNWDTRKFNIDIHNGAFTRTNYNIMTEAALQNNSSNPLDGAKKVAKLTAEDLNVTGGDLVIKFTKVSNDPIVNAIELFKQGSNTVDVAGVSLSPTSLSIDTGGTGTLTPTVTPSDATDKSLSWSSTDTDVATVDGSGVVTGVSQGTATITATSVSNNTISAQATVEVTGTTQPPTTGGHWTKESDARLHYTTGNVGIGTSTPGAYKLAVNGDIRAKKVKVETANWPDYVFTEAHDLPTLEEVRQHIAEKGHLPNIPSATEVEANGLDLGEMNRLLLEKLEELTLYILDQEKRMGFQEYRTEQLEKQVRKLKATQE